jgi:hypothetical protein
MGASTRTMTIDLMGANAEAQDISFLIDFANTLPGADTSKVEVIGYSWVVWLLCSRQVVTSGSMHLSLSMVLSAILPRQYSQSETFILSR